MTGPSTLVADVAKVAAATCQMPDCNNIVEDVRRRVCDACMIAIPPGGAGEMDEIERETTGKEPTGMDLEQTTETVTTEAKGADEPMKVCSRCPERGPQPLENFHKAKLGKFGRSAFCRRCKSAIAKEAGKKSGAKRRANMTKLGATPKASRAPEVVEAVEAVQPASITACGLNENELKDAESPAREIDASPLLLTLDLSAYPEMLEEIKRQAKEDDRTPEAQVRWWLRCRLGYVANMSEPVLFPGYVDSLREAAA